MADTVKKSRIVSDEDNLEDTLMEEFNMRLKNCMSQDNLQEPLEEPEVENMEVPLNIYENLISPSEIIKKASKDFIQIESEHVYDEPRSLIIKNGTSPVKENGHSEILYENLPQKNEEDKTEELVGVVDQQEQENVEVVEKIGEIQQEEEELEEEQEYEIVGLKNMQTPDFTLQTDLCPDLEEPPEDLGSVKNRMFLATDDASCLLFTQTVTSPMLTPSEENIDFLKGFQSKDSPPVSSESDSPKPESTEDLENIYENVPPVVNEEPIYENIEDLKMDLEEVEPEVILEEVEPEINLEEQLEEEPTINLEPEKLELEEEAEEKYTELIHHTKAESQSNYLEKYSEVATMTRSIESREKDTESVPAQIVKNLKSQFSQGKPAEVVGSIKKENSAEVGKTGNILKHISKFEQQDVEIEQEDSSEISESYVETSTTIETKTNGEKAIKKKKSKKSRKEEKENISVNGIVVDKDYCYNVNVKSLKSSFSKFDALQKKNVLHIRSSDSSKAQEKFNGTSVDTKNCKACAKAVFQMEQIKAEKAVWHKNCFRCTECNKQLTVDTYESHEGSLFCRPHFKALFAPKAVEEETPQRPRKPELIIRENQPLELPPDVVRASDKPDLGLEELQSLNVKERFQVFEHHQTETSESDRNQAPLNVKRSPSILSKLARFQAKGMDVGVADESLNGIPIEESSSEDEELEEEVDGEDADLIRAKRVQKEKPFHFTGMSDVKNKWEHGEQNSRDERREERKQEIQSIRNRLFMGKQGKMKEAYQQAVMESESCTNLLRKSEIIESCDTKSLKDRFEKGELPNSRQERDTEEDVEVFESEISKKSRSLFLELDANASKPPQISPVTPSKLEVKKTREVFLAKSASQDVVKSSELQDDVEVKTADIQQRFKFFETYKEPQQVRKQFRITPPRDGQVKEETPDREIYRDPDVVRAEEFAEDDSGIAKETHTATKMLNKFRQLEETMSKEHIPSGPKPLKRFTPPPEPARLESNSEEDESGSEEESEEEEDEVDDAKTPDDDLLEAKKAARAKQLRAKFERWEANEIKREQNNSSINIAEEFGEEQSQIESTKSLRARFESMRETSSDKSRTPRVKVNRFVDVLSVMETCQSCEGRVYPLEKISVHGLIYHKKCFKCMECSCILRMDSYSYNQGLLYCIPHFKRLFISKGNYDTGFGLGQHKEKWNPNATIA